MRNGKVAAVESSGPNREAIVTFSAGGRPHKVYSTGTGTITSFSFSCDGRKIVFSQSGGEPRRKIAILDLSTGKERPVPTGHLTAHSPFFIPGGKVVFSGSVGAEFSASGEGGTYVVDLDGSHLHRLFRRQEIAVSPDGLHFVATDPRGNFHTLYLLDDQGRILRTLAPSAPHFEYLNPHFSPDGSKIAYERRPETSPLHCVLYLVDSGGTQRRRLTFGSESASGPSFSPDGTWIVFTRNERQVPNGNVFALSLDDLAKTRKFGLSYGYQYPEWAAR